MTEVTGVLVVQTNAVAGREDEFERWYDGMHIPEILTIPGFVAAQRFVLEPDARPGETPAPFRYLAIYELDVPVVAAAASLVEAIPGLTWTESIDSHRSLVGYVAAGPRVER